MRKFYIVMLIILVYILGYIWFRNSNVEIWPRDNRPYVIFPKNSLVVYYVFRPLSYIDGKLMGMQFHIGPHIRE